MTPPGKMLRVEIMKESALPTRLTQLGFKVAWREYEDHRRWAPVDVIEIAVDGR